MSEHAAVGPGPVPEPLPNPFEKLREPLAHRSVEQLQKMHHQAGDMLSHQVIAYEMARRGAIGYATPPPQEDAP